MAAVDLNPVLLGDFLSEMIPKLHEALEKSEAHEIELREALEAQRSEVVRIRRALTLLDSDYEHPNAPKKPKKLPGHIGVRRQNGTATGFGITVEKAEEVFNAIERLGAEGKDIDQTTVRKMLDLDQSKVSAAFRYLREQEKIRKAGRAQGRDIYKLMEA